MPKWKNDQILALPIGQFGVKRGKIEREGDLPVTRLVTGWGSSLVQTAPCSVSSTAAATAELVAVAAATATALVVDTGRQCVKP